MSEFAIHTDKLTKQFGGHLVVDELSLRIPTGSVYGFLGSNGAGKTTSIRMLMGHLHPSSGTVETLGSNPWTHNETTQRRIAYVSERMALPNWMTAESAISMNQKLFPNWDATLCEQLVGEFDLRKIGRFECLSKGQQRKILILLALCQGADLLILDEPASGLDLESRTQLLDRILDVVCGEGRTVLLSSHLLTDVEKVVDSVGILQKGRLVVSGDLEELKSKTRKLLIQGDVSSTVLADHFCVQSCREPAADGMSAIVTDYSDEAYVRLQTAVGESADLQVHALNLEQLYLEFQNVRHDEQTQPAEHLPVGVGTGDST